jgi:peptidoglycan/LPS O-acetylase OafA/YrhL
VRPKVNFENLDSFRFLAFFGVFLLHCESRLLSVLHPYPVIFNSLKTILPSGALGVNFFFVLSGFLITWLLLLEEDFLGKYSTVNFWVRRILRIWPLYFACVIYGFWIYGFIYRYRSDFVETAEPKYFLTFLPNFNTIYNGFAKNTTLNVLWSVGVEEQFYLLWPLLFMIKKFRPYLFFLIIFSSLVFRYMHINLMSNYSVPPMKYHSFNVMGDLAVGGCLAWLCHTLKFRQNGVPLNKYWNGSLYTLGFLFFLLPFHNAIFLTLKPLIISIIFAYIIFEQVFVQRRFYNIGKAGFLDKWGKYTYGLYCLHPVGILIGYNISKLVKLDTKMFWVCSGEIIVSLACSMMLAYLSYHYFESPFLKLKTKFSYLVTGKKINES